MRKIISKIAGLMLGLSLAAGVGVSLGKSKVHETRAASIPSNYTLLTTSNLSSLTTSDKVVIVATVSGNATGVTGYSSSDATVSTTVSDWKEFAVTNVDTANSKYSLKDSSTNKWITLNASNKFTIASGSQTSLNAHASGYFNYTDSNSDSRFLAKNGSYYRCYKGNTQSSYAYFYVYKAPAAKTLSSISVSGYTTSFTVGDTFSFGGTVTANYSDSTSADVTSSATFSGYNMAAAGNYTVTASYTEGGVTKTATYSITVSAPSTPYVTPAESALSGYTGTNESLSFSYGNLTGSLSVVSSNTAVATVGTPSLSGSTGTVQVNYVGAGSTTIKFNDGSVERASVSVSVTASSVSISGLPASSTAYIGKTTNLGSLVTVTATGNYTNAVTWESDDESVATVSSAGVVTGVAEGTASISVTSDDYPSATMSCSVTVSAAPLTYEINFGSTKNTNPTEIKTDTSFKSTWSGNDLTGVTVGDFSKIYGISSSQLKCGSGSATASISFTIPSDSYITSVVVVVETAGGSSLNVVSGASGAQTENQSIAVGTLTFDDYLASEKSNYVLITSTASGAFYLSSIKINYANFAAELSASPSSFDVAVNNSQLVSFTPSHFTPTSYSAVVKSGSSLTTAAVAFSGNTATITAGSTAGLTVFTITGTGGGKSASVDVSVNVTQVRNLLTFTVTTASDATSFKVGDEFDVGSLVITATFDADPTSVVYSKANGNLGVLTVSPAIGYVFQESDIGSVTSASLSLTVGTGSESVSYTISVADKTYAEKVTDVSSLWDGQQIYFGNGTDRVNIEHAGGNQLGSQEATIDSSKGLCVDDLAHDGAYTVHREKIDSVVYYSFVKNGYYLEASNTTQNYLTKTDEITDKCRFTISISSGEITMTNKGNSDRPEFRWNTGSNWFSQYKSDSTLDKAVIYAFTPYSASAVAESFTSIYLHMDENVSGQCNTYYPLLKTVWAAMSASEKGALSADAEARLVAWAAAHGEVLDANLDIVAGSRNSFQVNELNKSSTVVIVVVALTSITSIGVLLVIKRKRSLVK